MEGRLLLNSVKHHDVKRGWFTRNGTTRRPLGARRSQGPRRSFAPGGAGAQLVEVGAKRALAAGAEPRPRLWRVTGAGREAAGQLGPSASTGSSPGWPGVCTAESLSSEESRCFINFCMQIFI